MCLWALISGANALVDPAAYAQDVDQTAIKLCWQEQARKDLTDDAKRLAASACYHMQDEYKAKYNWNP